MAKNDQVSPFNKWFRLCHNLLAVSGDFRNYAAGQCPACHDELHIAALSANNFSRTKKSAVPFPYIVPADKPDNLLRGVKRKCFAGRRFFALTYWSEFVRINGVVNNNGLLC